MAGIAGQFLGEGVQVVDDRGGVACERGDPLDLGPGVEGLGQLVAVHGVDDRQAGTEVVELPHHQVLPDLRYVSDLGPGGLGEVAQVQPCEVVDEPVGLAGRGEAGVVLEGPVVRAQRSVGLYPVPPPLLQLGRGVEGVERRLGGDQPAAESTRRAALVLVLLAVAVVDDVLGEQELARPREAFEVGRPRMLEYDGPAELEPREVPRPRLGEHIQPTGPGLQPAVDLRDLLGVGGDGGPVPQPGDRPARPGPRGSEARWSGQAQWRTGCRWCVHSGVRPTWTFSRIPAASGTRMAIE